MLMIILVLFDLKFKSIPKPINNNNNNLRLFYSGPGHAKSKIQMENRFIENGMPLAGLVQRSFEFVFKLFSTETTHTRRYRHAR